MVLPKYNKPGIRSHKPVKKFSICVFVGISMVLGCVANAAESIPDSASFAAPLHDPLLTPAIKSPLAKHSFIIDAARAGDRLFSVGERGHILYSDDQGESWRQAEVPVSITVTAVAFPVPEKGWAVGHQGVILHSVDGGKTWQVQFNGLEAGKLWMEFAEENLNKAKAALVEGDLESEEVLDLADLALGDAEVSTEFGPSQPLLDLWFRDEHEGIAVGSYGDIFRTVDGGQEWRVHRHAIKNPNNFHYYSIDQAPSGVLYLAGERGGIYRSRDIGKSWIKLNSPYKEGSFYRTLAFEYEGEEVVLLMGFGGHLYRSVDEGDTWKKVETPTSKSINDGAVLGDGSVVLVGLSGTLLHSTDGGLTFRSRLDSRGFPYTSVLALTEQRLLVTGAVGAEVVTVPTGEESKQ